MNQKSFSNETFETNKQSIYVHQLNWMEDSLNMNMSIVVEQANIIIVHSECFFSLYLAHLSEEDSITNVTTKIVSKRR